MARPIGVKESKPRKRVEGMSRPDSQAYRYPDSGCHFATKFLSQGAGESMQSRCFECPFTKCKMDGNWA